MRLNLRKQVAQGFIPQTSLHKGSESRSESQPMPSTPKTATERTGFLVAVFLVVLLVLRVIGIVTTSAELYADEAQYWRWSRTIEWGYYSKPPMIA
ncbi:MAG: hypothetical protein AAGI03_03545, partial [Pseudomonadota bacterium]